MDGNIIAALIAVGGLVLVNIGIGLFHYGRYAQTIKDLCRRVARLEACINNKGGNKE